MIFGNLKNFRHQIPTQGKLIWEKSHEALEELNSDSPLGITPLLHEKMYRNVHSYKTKPDLECRFESHRHTIDVQCMLSGSEVIYFSDRENLGEIESYDAEADFEMYPESILADHGSLILSAGQFVVFFPEDVHCPQVRNGESETIKKVVVKIDCSLLPIRPH